MEIFEIINLDDSMFGFRTPLLFSIPENSKIIETTCISNLLKESKNFQYLFSMNKTTLLPFSIIYKYIQENKEICEYNHNFIINTPIIYDAFKDIDKLLKPVLSCSTITYDIILGSKPTTLKYLLDYFNYFIITEGIIEVILTPYTNLSKQQRKFDYENIVGICSDFDETKIPLIRLKLKKGNVLYVPNFWYYSFNFIEKNSSISSLSYRSIMNDIAILPYHLLHYLQLQNIKYIPSQIISKQTTEN